MSGATEAIRAEKLVKAFGNVTALAGVSMHVALGRDARHPRRQRRRQIDPDQDPDRLSPARFGAGFVDGKPVQLGSVDEARALGIECVYQDLALVNGLSIYHNMFLNRELLRGGPLRLLDHREMRRRAAEALAEIGVDVPSVELEVGRSRAGSARRSRWRARSIRRRASCCSTSRSRRWARARRG